MLTKMSSDTMPEEDQQGNSRQGGNSILRSWSGKAFLKKWWLGSSRDESFSFSFWMLYQYLNSHYFSSPWFRKIVYKLTEPPLYIDFISIYHQLKSQ